MKKGFGVSPVTNTIYYGQMNKEKNIFTGDKEDVTDDAIAAVFEWFVGNMEGRKGEYRITYKNSEYELAMRKRGWKNERNN